jgi:hypothetical protein
MKPLFSLEHLVLAMGLLTVACAFCAWRTSAKARRRDRIIMTILRFVALVLLAVIALNPGHWRQDSEEMKSEWVVLLDRSQSMATEDVDGETRWDEARRIAIKARSLTDEEGALELMTFSGTLESVPGGDLTEVEPDGEMTDILQSGRALLGRYRSGSKKLAGIILLSDGKQVADSTHDDLALRARSQEVPIYPIVLGGAVERRDIVLLPGRRQYVTFAGQKTRITAVLSAEGLGNIRPIVSLHDSAGKELAKQRVSISDGEKLNINFDVSPMTKGYYEYVFKVAAWDGEASEVNNVARTGVAVMDDRMSVLLTEGVPFWDSKFLAQLLRKQPNMSVASVYRLSSERFFRIEADSSNVTDHAKSIFPDSVEEISPYDMIVFGKGVEYFLSSDRIKLLRSFVRDQGGCVIFARGKPYSGSFPELESLEPLEWGTPLSSKFEFKPTQAGEDVGLFGDLLPAPDDPVWARLPELQYAYRASDMKTFVRVLAEGSYNSAGKDRSVPLIVSRRYGKGVVIVLNAEGLWQWDFFPSIPEAGKMYKELWIQLIQWAATYSEYLPGQEYALKLSDGSVLPDAPVRARVSYRGSDKVKAQPTIKVMRGDKIIQEFSAVKSGAEEDRWDAIFSLGEPGSYRIQLASADDLEGSGPCATLYVKPPTAEKDEVSADVPFLDKLASGSGGRIIEEEEIEGLLKRLEPEPEELDMGKAVWIPEWDKLWLVAIVLSLFVGEWFLRRRNGLM